MPNGAEILRRQEALGLSQTKLAESAGLGVRTVRKAQKGKKRVRPGTIEALAAALDVPPPILLADPEDAPVVAGWHDLSQPLNLPTRLYDPSRCPPGALLRAEFRQVPFHGREELLTDYQAWLTSPDQVSVRLLTGAGGMGKTRFALELAIAARDNRWVAGFASEDTINALSQKEPGLVIIDYAETRRRLVELAVAQGLIRRGPTRLVLLARAATDWWHELLTTRGEVGDLLSSRSTTRHRMEPLALDEGARQLSYDTALRAFSAALGAPPAAEAKVDFAAPEFDRVLLLHMHALSRLEQVPVKGENGLLDVTLAREERLINDN